MNFLNQPLAWGALAFSIPLILHILNRSRFRQVEWGAMHLLESVVKVNHKRFRLEQLLLLLVRCAIPALLAMCLARPVLTGSQMLAGDAPVSMVILLDTSYSMDATTGDVARFEKAIDAACAIVGATARGSEIAVIRTGGGPMPLFDQPIFDAEAVVRRLRTLRAGYGASDMQQSLDVGMTALAEMSHARRELIVISDFQAADWGSASTLFEVVNQQIESMPIKPELTLLQVGEEVVGNVSIESLEFSTRPLGVGQQLAVRANLRNHADRATENARVVLKVDGIEQGVSQLALAGNASTQTLFPCNFEQAGSHVIEVEAAVYDSLSTDNSFAAAITIWDEINVLLVDGAPSSQALKGETDFLSVALTPYSFARVKLSDLVRTQTVTPDKVKADLLSEFRVVVLANVPRLKDDQIEALRSFVQDGGALLVFAGSGIDTKWYNEKLFANGSDLLPAEFGVPQGKIDDQGQSARIVAQHFDHPALEFFNEAANGDLSTAEIRQWYELKPNTTDTVVVAQLDNGDPLFVERSYGDGVVMQMATACDADWSDLPMRPVFVPLMQQLVTTMATQLTPPRNIETGEPAVALFSDPATATPEGEGGAESGTLLSIVTPEGSRQSLKSIPQGKRQMARFDGTRRPGVYTMTTPDSSSLHFVASTSREESNLDMLDEMKLTTLADGLSAKVVASPEDYLEQESLRRHGREIWKYVLFGLLAFMFLEVVLQQRFSRVRT